MPQMMPINWLILFILFILSFIMFNIMNYYIKIYKIEMKKNFFNDFNKNYYWKW
uniref:ATP synthase complex subunit 8 n=1 Tax=Scopula lactea TaxID=2992016 RepID=A0A9E7V5Z5_9NEOP|nr:ATP synthase F0 subunit 8 [Scopula lactea]UYX62370.1 ATP synthase F0 subunit 8 [Scopula lactea]